MISLPTMTASLKASGGAHTSRTMMLAELRQLLSAAADTATTDDYRRAVLEENVLAKASSASRQRSYRYLRELYALDPVIPAFRALRTLWEHDHEAQPLIALASAVARDPALRGTAAGVLDAPQGSSVTAEDLADAVLEAYPESYSEAVAHKIGRNAASTWTQAGHLAGRVKKVRVRANPRPTSVAYALFLASLEGREGELLFDALPVRAQDAPPHALRELARDAARRGWLEFRSVGAVTEVGFSYLRGTA